MNRLAKITTLGEDGAQIGVGASVLWIERDRSPELGDRPGEVSGFGEGDAQPVVRRSGPRPELDGALKRLQRARVVVPLQVRQAERDMKSGTARIALDGGLELAD